ncbi:hypothetical protein NGF19_27440 [Streptomyces sp. RY43-2]|uniref:Integral membrane protein n=1 Tax=Streptomyces macrolidinus TaxID=2952607 RepID=A0ABT0ZLT8_9ACTN|nr:hypothetical protein [Streptomyces macrolidinus]MCN9244472.1 hypothetical protein [Streptomyces macrolidinus]
MRGTGGPPHSGVTAGRAESGGFFALILAWAAGLIALFISSYIQITYFYEPLATPERLESFGGRLLYVHLPNVLCIALTTWIAGRVHREPFRESTPRHLAALFAVPLFAQIVNVVMYWGRSSTEGLLLSCVVVVVGAVAGYGVDRLQEGER